ncbi:membrane protein [Lentilactobacillus fungorum]|uniref:Membrane protein n=1 Tax=Lentilactobacillus fungorum TaxID=2201250 RepID=A0ABQ3VXE6_9LACO|nr:FtsX-like permease family protein [Lentilactobacillus fungorum]GHP13215.1 membrane protein [Lentilactobacillus fungorum]
MLRIIWLQFRHSLKTWLLTLLLFIVTGFLIGTCLNAIFTIRDHFPNVPKPLNPTDVFAYPLIFGLLTVAIVSSGVVKLVIDGAKKEYTLWTILGANPRQLSGLIGGQLALIGALGSFVGFVLAVPLMVPLDTWLIVSFGLKAFFRTGSVFPFEFSFSACLLTVGFMAIVSGIAGYLHAHKRFVHGQNEILTTEKPRSLLQQLTYWSVVAVSTLGLVLAYGDSLIITPQAQRYLRVDNFHEAGKAYIPNLLLIILCSIVLFTAVAQLILPWLIKLWTLILPKKSSLEVNTAFWHTLVDKPYLASLISPLVAGSFMLTGITYIASDITNFGTNQEAAANTEASIIGFVGTPLLIILANVLTITIMTSASKRATLTQLAVLGFAPRNLIDEKIQEAFIYSTTFLISAVIMNIPFHLIVTHLVIATHNAVTLPWTAIFIWPVWLWLMMVIFIIAVNAWQVWRFTKKNQLMVA